MSFKFFHIPVRDAAAAEEALNTFLGNHRVLSIDRRWVDQGADSFWSFCVDYYEGKTATRGQNLRTKGKNYKEVLSPGDFAVYAGLRDLRKEIAQAEAVPVYTIFTNEQLAQMVQASVQTKADRANGDRPCPV